MRSKIRKPGLDILAGKENVLNIMNERGCQAF